MSGLFEHLANTDESHRLAGRKAVALARVRADKSFGRFIAAAVDTEDREARLALVAGDLEQLVRQACADCDYQAHENVLSTIQEHLGYIVEARRPKMCPYHKEVTDISLASGEPQAGFAAMAQHAWGPKHCQGGEFEGGCNFKPEMTTQTYWDNKAQQAQERRDQRMRQIQQEQPAQQVETPELEHNDSFDEHDEFNPPEDGTSAVGIGAEPAVADPMAMAASTRQADTLKTVDVQKGGEGPSPKMDKRKWTPENVSFLDVEMDGSPHPTRHQDIAQGAQYKGDGLFSDDGRFDQTDAALEKQDVEKSSNPTDGGGPATSTFPKGDQAKPVTSAVDPDRNPIAELLDEEEAQRAISAYKQANPFPGGGYGTPGHDADFGNNSPFEGPGYHDEPETCPGCGAYGGAFAHGHCVNCGYQENNVPGSGPGGPGTPPPHRPTGPVDIPGEFS